MTRDRFERLWTDLGVIVCMVWIGVWTGELAAMVTSGFSRPIKPAELLMLIVALAALVRRAWSSSTPLVASRMGNE